MARQSRTTLDICIGKSGKLVGELSYVKQGARGFSVFAYDDTWLADSSSFEVSPDLPLVAGHATRRARSPDDACFHFAFSDTSPDPWGCRVIARAHAKQRQVDPALPALTALDYLTAVDDFSRVGALRLRDEGGYLASVEEGKRRTPPLLDLAHLYAATKAVEGGKETVEDLDYLMGKGTSLGGMRPKCTVLDSGGALALGKFPSIHDQRSVTRGEVLAMRLARRAGVDTAAARIVKVGDVPVAVITRFDRTVDDSRIPYLSAASMLQAARHEDRTYTDIVDVIRARCTDPVKDARELWRRLIFNLLITNVDDHLHNLGFLYAGQGKWRLAPSFDLNPFPDKDRESKTWLSDDLGPITSLLQLMRSADYFGLRQDDAKAMLAESYSALREWRAVARSAEVGLGTAELTDFAPAFEHPELETARSLVA